LIWSIVDLLASEYGWTKDYIMYHVYPVELTYLYPKINGRKKNEHIDLLQALVTTNPNIDPKAAQEFISNTDRARHGDPGQSGPVAEELDRSGMEKLRQVMGRKKGRAPVRVQ
jgi:hypothetical protein